MVRASLMPHKGEQSRILVHYDRPEPLREAIAGRFPDAALECCTTYAELAGALAEFAPDILFCIKFENRPYPREAVMDCPTLAWVSNGGAGVDHLMPWDPERLTVTNASGVASAMMAEYVIGGMLALAIDLPGFLRRQVERRWQLRPVAGIAGKTVCIVGLGRTGRAVAGLAKAHGMHVVGTRANPADTPGVDSVYPASELHAAIRQGDFVVVTAPLLEETRHLIDGAALDAMKPGARLVDVSRGGVVDQAALTDALAAGRLAGAVLDVFEGEPLAEDSLLWDMENVVITPHCSSVYEGWELAAVNMFCENLERRLAGSPLENVVDPARGY
jgi:phosphoglycerate dehydrogenase-like enzyme